MKNYQQDDGLIKSYFEFTQRVFSFDLAIWRDKGHWKEKYVPHSLILDNRVIANISAGIMRLQLGGRDIQAVQLGSVGVLPEYRGIGLSRVLMERVLEEYRSFPLLFLFAGEAVSEFYPRFGFRRIEECIPFINTENRPYSDRPERISADSGHIKRLLGAKLQHSSVIDSRGNPGVYMYHLIYNYNENIYYIKEKDVVFIAAYEKETVDVYDIMSEKKVSFRELEGYILRDAEKQVRFHFTPDWLDVDYGVMPYQGNALHVLGELAVSMDKAKFPQIGRT